jgi:hypothetical protein
MKAHDFPPVAADTEDAYGPRLARSISVGPQELQLLWTLQVELPGNQAAGWFWLTSIHSFSRSTSMTAPRYW